MLQDNNEYQLGYIYAASEPADINFDAKSAKFIAGFTQYMRDAAHLDGNLDTDSFDY
jgi:hypothetical protein